MVKIKQFLVVISHGGNKIKQFLVVITLLVKIKQFLVVISPLVITNKTVLLVNHWPS